MKKFRTAMVLLLSALMIGMTACKDPEPEKPESSSEISSEVSEESSQQEEKVTLYADFSNGSEEAESLNLIKSKEITVSEKTPESLAKELSEWSGLDFTLNSVKTEGKKITVDWSVKSTLIANLDDREQKEDFHFFDVDSMGWFMMDSLWRTLQENLGAEEVYYTMDGGKELLPPDMSSWAVIPIDVPYLGSPFYAAHSNLKGDDDEPEPQNNPDNGDFSAPEGIWYLENEFKGFLEPAQIHIDSSGRFTSYCFTGEVYAEGNLEIIDEGGGSIKYNMYRDDGSFVDGIYVLSKNKIQLTEQAAPCYFREGSGEDNKLYLNVWVPGEEADSLQVLRVELDNINETTIAESMVAEELLPAGTVLYSVTAEDASICADFSQEFEDHLNQMGTTGEAIITRCVANTLIEAYRCDGVRFTVEGRTLETGHADYADYMTWSEEIF